MPRAKNAALRSSTILMALIFGCCAKDKMQISLPAMQRFFYQKSFNPINIHRMNY